MPRAFCTLFDSNYLLKGLALHASLMEHCSDFTLWVLCMDAETHATLSKLALPSVHLIRLADFEDAQLRRAKEGRKASEYCWTCTPSLPLYVLKQHPELDSIAYVDADLFFYASPEPVYQELGGQSILIERHNFSDGELWREKTSGTYNVGMLIFKNDANARACLEWWRDKCLEWCFDTYDNGRLGDQLYLNDWPTRFGGVVVLKNEGADMASWNVRNYKFSRDGAQAENLKTGARFPFIFYHFHAVRVFKTLRGVRITAPGLEAGREQVVAPSYEAALAAALARVRTLSPGFSKGLESPRASLVRLAKRVLFFI